MKFFTPQIKIATLIFISLNIFLYLFLYLFNDRIPFNYENYQFNATKFIEDSRATQGKFDLINNLAQFDAQWYLKIAEAGYPTNPHSTALEVMDGATFAFFPLYPIILKILNIFIMNILLTGFLFANFMLLINFWSLIYVLKKFTDEKIAIRTAFLLFLFPFSIFFRSYFTESLFLFLLIWFTHFLLKKVIWLADYY